MSEEEKVYVENNSGIDLRVEIKVNNLGVIEVYLDKPEEGYTIEDDCAHTFEVPAGDE